MHKHEDERDLPYGLNTLDPEMSQEDYEAYMHAVEREEGK